MLGKSPSVARSESHLGGRETRRDSSSQFLLIVFLFEGANAPQDTSTGTKKPEEVSSPEVDDSPNFRGL